MGAMSSLKHNKLRTGYYAAARQSSLKAAHACTHATIRRLCKKGYSDSNRRLMLSLFSFKEVTAAD
jgi:hypothetical protein